MNLLDSPRTIAALLLFGVAAAPLSASQSVGTIPAGNGALGPHDFRSGDIYFLDHGYPSTAPSSVIRKLKLSSLGSAHSTFFSNPGGNLSVLEYDSYRKALIIHGGLGSGTFPGTYAIDVDGNVSQFLNWAPSTKDVASNGTGLIYLLSGRVSYLDASDVPHNLIDSTTTPPTNSHFFFEVPSPCGMPPILPCNPPLTQVSKIFYQQRTNSLFALGTVSTSTCSTTNVVLQAVLDATGTQVEEVRGPYYLTDPCAVAFTLTSGPAGLPMTLSGLNGELWADKVAPGSYSVSNYYHGQINVPVGTYYSSSGAYSSFAHGTYLMGTDVGQSIRTLIYYSPTTGPIEVMRTPSAGTAAFASAAAGEMLVIP